MTYWTLIRRGLRFHARSHVGTLLGVTIGSAILIGALAVGDSVRESLRAIALSRLGQVDHALTSNDRFFRADLAGELASAGFVTAGALQISGTASSDSGDSRANNVQVLGVDERFWNMSPGPAPIKEPGTEDIALNQSLAEQLKATLGDTILLRIHKPSLLSRDAPISPQQDASTAFRLTVRQILPASAFGNFSLRASQIPPFNAFVSLKFLQEKLGLEGKANLLLSTETKDGAIFTRHRLARTFPIGRCRTAMGHLDQLESNRTAQPPRFPRPADRPGGDAVVLQRKPRLHLFCERTRCGNECDALFNGDGHRQSHCSRRHG